MNVAAREAVRLVRASWTRSAVIAVTIAAATVAGVLASAAVDAVGLGCIALAFSTLVVARRSPRPERIASATAWSRAGASRTDLWLCGLFEALLLGWAPTLVAGVITTGLIRLSDPSQAYGRELTYLAWQLGLLGLAACLPTTRVRDRQRSRLQRHLAPARLAVAVLVVGFALLVMFPTATNIRSDFDLGLSGFVIIALLIVVGLVVSGRATSAAVAALGRVSRLRALGAIAARFRVPGTVRFVMVASVTIATSAAILGASVQARPDTKHALDERLAQLPTLPANVALVRVDPTGLITFNPSQWSALSSADLEQLRAAISRAVPNARTIPLHEVYPTVSAEDCDECDNGPLVVEEPRLQSIYQTRDGYPRPRAVAVTLATPFVAPKRTVEAFTRARSRDELERELRGGRSVPPATFAGAQYYEIPPVRAASLDLDTRVRSVFIRASRPVTSTQLARLVRATRTLATPSRSEITVIGPRGQLAPAAHSPDFDVSGSINRDVSWAAVTAGSRWALAITAGLLALVMLLVALTIDTIDRRRDVQRLERLGATPTQVRGAAALYATALFMVMTWVCTILVVGLVKAGTDSFNRAEPTIPVPFTMPWLVILFLAIGLPLIAGALSALVARPTWLESQPR